MVDDNSVCSNIEPSPMWYSSVRHIRNWAEILLFIIFLTFHSGENMQRRYCESIALIYEPHKSLTIGRSVHRDNVSYFKNDTLNVGKEEIH